MAGDWRLALLVGIIAVAAADERYVIWRSSAGSGFDWEPASGAYSSKDACDEAIEARKRRLARTLAILRRIGADDTLQRAVGDRIYECRPTLTGPPTDPFKGGAPQSP
ncbi:MAG TPA: hypothetical protein VFS98_12725 [Methylomirabilota bacterium]|nr:hypothetical protein [Methylomirabilota bacterium]